jgi:hypothetical protein
MDFNICQGRVPEANTPGGAGKAPAGHGHHFFVGLTKKAQPFLSSAGWSVPKCPAGALPAPPGVFASAVKGGGRPQRSAAAGGTHTGTRTGERVYENGSAAPPSIKVTPPIGG